MVMAWDDDVRDEVIASTRTNASDPGPREKRPGVVLVRRGQDGDEEERGREREELMEYDYYIGFIGNTSNWACKPLKRGNGP